MPSVNFIEIESDPNIDPFGRQDLAECWSRPMKQCGGQAASERALEKRCSERAACSGAGAVFEAPALVAGLDDIAMMSESVGQCGCHLRIA